MRLHVPGAVPMKPLICLVALLSMASADAALAKTTVVGRAPHAAAATHVSAKRASVKHRRRASMRRTLVSARVSRRMVPQKVTAVKRETDQPGSQGPGWIKTDERAGYGVKDGRSETVVGLYRRPMQPILGGPDTFTNEGRGAAGVSLSIPLGH